MPSRSRSDATLATVSAVDAPQASVHATREALKQQNWAAIAIEFVLLVGGVFFGIQVANWNQQRLSDKQGEIFTDRPMQKRFEADPLFQASTLVLQERIPKATAFYAHSTELSDLRTTSGTADTPVWD